MGESRLGSWILHYPPILIEGRCRKAGEQGLRMHTTRPPEADRTSVTTGFMTYAKVPDIATRSSEARMRERS